MEQVPAIGGKRLNVLFIVPYTYQARTIQIHLENLNPRDSVDLLVNKTLTNRKNPNMYWINKYYRNKIRNVYECYLPFDFCYNGRDTSFRFSVSAKVRKLFDVKSFSRIENLIRDRDYDYIYLSSLILHRLITEQHNFIIHVQEIYDGSNPAVFENVKKAKGVIFVDNATKKAFETISLNSIIINLPFHSTQLVNDNNRSKKTVFAIIGRIEPVKGVDLVIRAFRKTASDSIELWIVGSGNSKYLRQCYNAAGDDPRIRFCGNIENIQTIYDNADFVIRGDPQQCTGRTTYEGLYSGCHVIIPGSDPKLFHEYEQFEDMVHFYDPCDEQNLTSIIESYAGKKITGRRYFSNATEYVNKFNDFVKKSLVMQDDLIEDSKNPDNNPDVPRRTIAAD